MAKYVATKALEKFTNAFKEGDELVGISEEECIALEALGNAKKVDDEQDAIAEPKRRPGRPTNAERAAREAGKTE